MFTHLAERPELSFGLQTENINGSRVYTTPEGNKYSSVTTVLGELIKADIQKWRESIGEKEAKENTVSVRRRFEGDIGSMNLDSFSSKLIEEINQRRNTYRKEG